MNDPRKGRRPAGTIEAALRQRLANREPTCIGQTFHSERALQAEFGATRETIRRALQPLIDDGMLEVRRGAPTRIRSRHPRPDPIPTTLQLQALDDQTLCDLEDRVRTEVRRRWQPQLTLTVDDQPRPRESGQGLRPRR